MRKENNILVVSVSDRGKWMGNYQSNKPALNQHTSPVHIPKLATIQMYLALSFLPPTSTLPPRKSGDKYCALPRSRSFSLSVSSCFLLLSLSCFFSAPRTTLQQWDNCPPSCKGNDCHPSPNNNDHQDPNWQRAMTMTTTTTQTATVNDDDHYHA